MTDFPTWPSFSEEEAQAAYDVIRSNKVNYWTGHRIKEFEDQFSAWTGTDHAVAVTNGTLALELALRAMDIGPGDEVVVSPRSFLASVSCVLSVGATPIFADVDHDSGNLSAQTIRSSLTSRTRCVIVVHLAGWPADMNGIMELAASQDLMVIEDCAQAHGGKIGGAAVGSIGHVGAWSFCQDKIMTTGGEGGIVTTNDPVLYERMWSYKDHGKSRHAVFEQRHAPGFRWVHDSFGTNWRMLEVQAAIGSIQLTRMEDWHEMRERNAMALIRVLEKYPDLLHVPQPEPDYTHAYYRLYAYLRPELATEDFRNRLIAQISSRGFPVFHGSCPEIYLEKAFDGTELRPADRLPVAKELGETSLMFLTHPTIDDHWLAKYCEAVDQVLDQMQQEVRADVSV